VDLLSSTALERPLFSWTRIFGRNILGKLNGLLAGVISNAVSIAE
jgi:hypothetical protein